jgi:hypothetical protein
MTTDSPVPAPKETIQTPLDCRRHHYLCWEAVLAGTVAAMGIYLLLATLGIGANLAVFRHLTDAHPVENFSGGAAMTWSLFAIIALSAGGWIAGRCSGCLQSGCLHGTLVWSVALVIACSLLSAGAGLKKLIIHHEGWAVNARSVTPDKGDWAKERAKRSRDELCSFTQEAVQSIPTNAAPKAATRAQREVSFAVTKLFAPGNAAAFPANRLEAINALMVYTEMTDADATATIDAWTVSDKNLQSELDKIDTEKTNLKKMAEQKAKTAADAIANANADQMSHKHSWAARWSFFALLIGLLGAALGGRCGAKCALRNRNMQCAPAAMV